MSHQHWRNERTLIRMSKEESVRLILKVGVQHLAQSPTNQSVMNRQDVTGACVDRYAQGAFPQ